MVMYPFDIWLTDLHFFFLQIMMQFRLITSFAFRTARNLQILFNRHKAYRLYFSYFSDDMSNKCSLLKVCVKNLKAQR